MLVKGNDKYFRAPFNDEAEIETVVKDYAEYLFGSTIIFHSEVKDNNNGWNGDNSRRLRCGCGRRGMVHDRSGAGITWHMAAHHPQISKNWQPWIPKLLKIRSLILHSL